MSQPDYHKPLKNGLFLLGTLTLGAASRVTAGVPPAGGVAGNSATLSSALSTTPGLPGFSLKLGTSVGILLSATLLVIWLWHFCGGLRYRYALGYYASVALILGVTAIAPGIDTWLLGPERVLLLLLGLASIAGTAWCLALLYPYQPITPLRRLLQVALVINGVALATTAIVPINTAAVVGLTCAIGTSLVAAIASTACGALRRPSITSDSRTGQLRPLLLFGGSWLVIACGLLLTLPGAAAPGFSTVGPGNVLLLSLDLQLLLMSLALLDQAWLEYRDHLVFHRQCSEQARNSSSLLRARHQRLARHNQELSELLRQGDRLDPATGLLSARALHHELDREHKTAVRYGNHLSVVVVQIDVPGLDEAEQEMSPEMAVMAALARLVSTTLQRPGDIGGRITTNRIAVVLPYTDTNGAKHVAEQIRQRIEAMDQDPTVQATTLHFGVASTETQLARHADDLLESAMHQVGEQLSQPG